MFETAISEAHDTSVWLNLTPLHGAFIIPFNQNYNLSVWTYFLRCYSYYSWLTFLNYISVYKWQNDLFIHSIISDRMPLVSTDIKCLTSLEYKYFITA